MALYVLRRAFLAIPTMLMVALAVFVLVRLIPGDPAQLLFPDAGTPAQLAEARQKLGLDLPLPMQFVVWLEHIAAGDLGRSLVNRLPVLQLVLERAQVTAVVVLSAVTIAAVIAVPLGLVAAWRQNSLLDVATVSVTTIMLSIPAFWLGLLLLLLFGMKLQWFPVVGYVSFGENVSQALHYLILPIVTLTAIECGTLLRMSRANAIEVLRLEYITHARAKGLPEWRVLLRHVLPNAFAPTWTVIGLIVGHLLGGIAVLETVFTLPGLGRLLVDAIFARDYPVIQGCLLFSATVYVVVNLVVDTFYPLFDPRVAVE